ncbi:sulfurtransferase TusA family protein [Paenibacillus sp. MMO-177]|uniref:sulfurtransferase TusA family protein n=1 Tax=Paenibacillus sp. MMO-177 TaxID=3081289 RepID=UPI003015B30F
MTIIQADKTLDCKGLACPMPIVKTKKAIDELQAGQVIEVQATDKGSLADIQGWARNTGHQYLGTVHEGEVLKHFVRKANANEVKEEMKHPHSITNEELQKKIENKDNLTILDVREPAEYAFNHLHGAKSIPLGELEQRVHELNENDDIHVICRTGTRSDMACQLLTAKGFKQLTNILPGMSGWTGPTEKFI